MFQFPKSLGLAQLPTPIQRLQRFSQNLEGPDIFLKRDDLTGTLLTGNKVRKLDFLLAEAQQKKCDVVITCGGNQSNHARTTAVAAAQLGMKCHLVLKNKANLPSDGNLLIDKLVGASTQYISAEEYKRVDEIMLEAADQLKSEGLSPYIIPEGGSNALGTIGYIKAAEEITLQLQRLKTRIHKIVVAVGSGGTYAGLLIGKYLFDLQAEIYGFNVCDDKNFFTNKIFELIKEIQIQQHLNVKIQKSDINIIDGYVGKGYALSSQAEIDMIKKVAAVEGIVLDPVYTGKAMLGLVDKIKTGVFKHGENILFIHTGGVFGLFPKKSLFF